MDLVHTIFEPSGPGPHPTLLTLHGWGASAMDLLPLAPMLADGRFLVLCPQGPMRFPVAPGQDGFGWFPISGGGPTDLDAAARAVDALRRFLDEAVRRYPVDPDRLGLLGFSQGGVMAYALALAEPQRFAAVAALSSWLPGPLAAGVAGLPLPALVHHGSRDPIIPVERGRESVERLRQLQARVTYREFDMAHEINLASLTHLSEWLGENMLSRLVLAG